MFSLKSFRTLAFVLIVLLVGVVLAGVWVNANREIRADKQRTLVIAPNAFEADSKGAIRIVVQNFDTNEPVPDAEIQIRLEGEGKHATAIGKTNAQGTASILLDIPPDASRTLFAKNQTLTIETRSTAGSDTIKQSVTVKRTYKVLATSDKPLYQPGQTMHLRALALAASNRKPAAGQKLEFVVEDPKGTKVFNKILDTSAYGIASADFTLADRVNAGAYKITATLNDDVKSEKTVTVKPYVLPKFKLAVETAKKFYLPGERVRGTVRADYFFGKPVDNARVKLAAATYDVTRNEFIALDGRTNAEGVYEFAFELPNYFAGRGLDQDRADFSLELDVTDQAEHLEQSVLVVPIARAPIVIDAVAESGELVPDVENILYVLTATPDGAPVAADITARIDGKEYATQTGKYGIGEIRFTPRRSSTIELRAQDAQGNRADKSISLTADPTNQILVRPERAVYRIGDTLRLDLLTRNSTGTVYLDFVRDGQTLSTRAVATTNGRAQLDVDVTPDLVGTLQLHAYQIGRDANITRDTRIVVVEPADELAVNVTADRDVYRPGDTSRLTFDVKNKNGAGVASALGITAVDESVFALAEQDAGFAKLYFVLQNDLLEPRYELHGFDLPQVLGDTNTQTEYVAAKNESAQAAWANVPAPEIPVHTISLDQKRREFLQAQAQRFKGFNEALGVLLTLVPLAFGGLILAALHTRNILERALTRSAIVLVGLCIAAPFAAAILGALVYLFQDTFVLPLAVIALVIGWFTCYLVLWGYALKQNDGRVQIALALLTAYIVLLGVFAFTTRGSVADVSVFFGIAVVFLAAIVAWVVFGVGLLQAQERTAGWSALLLGVLMIPLTLLMAWLPSATPFARAMGTSIAYISPLSLLGCAAPATPPPGAFGMQAAAPTAAPQPTAAPAAAKANESSAPTSQAAPRTRSYFPETLYVNPQLITDENGHATLELPLADSITTWRLAALANSQNGELGTAQAGIRVFQDFFIDLDLPVALTQNDEIAIPVAVYNYLPRAQRVELEIATQNWFDLHDDTTKTINVAANDIDVVYFRITAREFGAQRLKVTARGETMGDALEREVRVYPDGKELEATSSNWLRGDATQNVAIPQNAIPGATRVEVKVYPGVMSQLVEGLDKIFRMPNGCFEQTSSTTYPNVLALTYLKQTAQVSPEVQMKAENYIGLGYQRLLTFENDGGGFSIFGNPPSSAMLSAKGLLEFSDMARVYPVDAQVLERTRRWLLSTQRSDGTWSGEVGWDHPHGAPRDPTALTAIVTWALAETGAKDERGTARAIAYLRSEMPNVKDAYTLALIANALVAYDVDDATTRDVLARLDEMKQTEDDAVYWTSRDGTFSGAHGEFGDLETTALAAHALLRGRAHLDSAQGALSYLIQHKDPRGTWGTTQATILALRALVASALEGGAGAAEGTVYVSFDDGAERALEFRAGENNAVQVLTFDDVGPGTRALKFRVNGKGAFAYQISTSYYVPWEGLDDVGQNAQGMTIHVEYDRTTLKVNDRVRATATIRLNEGEARMAVVDLGVPPGFAVLTDELDTAVKNGKLSRYEMTGRQIILYLENVRAGQAISLTYELQARFPLRVQAPHSTTYDYYNPNLNGQAPPIQFTVE
ncbi:MAG: hypothetical protein HY741_10455 [Chloroflexi bacterium]|nr:hypothetical protein [Chloroflexota bacterium]